MHSSSDKRGLSIGNKKPSADCGNPQRAEAKAEPSHSRFTPGKLYAAATVPTSTATVFSTVPCSS